MPVTIRTQPIDAATWLKATTNDKTAVFKKGYSIKTLGPKGLMQSSLDENHDNPTPNITPATNGLVDVTIEAWNNHHHLVLRPDDIWLSIISQLGFFINAHAEDLRELFVAHKGQKGLVVTQAGHPDGGVDYGVFAEQMAAEISKNVKDPDLVPWIIPKFTTTTDTDRVVGSVLLMGAMQQYFTYDFNCETCGIPSVTLLGERADWVDLQERISKIARLGGEAVEFHRLLAPIARYMLLSFDKPTSTKVVNFWRIIASRERPKYGMSGGPSEYLTGWITTFCFWKADGKKNNFGGQGMSYKIDGVKYSALEPHDKVTGWASTPVTVKWIDGGVVKEVRKCRMLAGSIGMRPGRHLDMGVRLDGLPLPALEHGTGEDGSDDEASRFMSWGGGHRKPGRGWVESWDEVQYGAPAPEAGFDAVQPHVGWWIFHVKDEDGEEEQAPYDQEKEDLEELMRDLKEKVDQYRTDSAQT